MDRQAPHRDTMAGAGHTSETGHTKEKKKEASWGGSVLEEGDPKII